MPSYIYKWSGYKDSIKMNAKLDLIESRQLSYNYADLMCVTNIVYEKKYFVDTIQKKIYSSL